MPEGAVENTELEGSLQAVGEDQSGNTSGSEDISNQRKESADKGTPVKEPAKETAKEEGTTKEPAVKDEAPEQVSGLPSGDFPK